MLVEGGEGSKEGGSGGDRCSQFWKRKKDEQGVKVEVSDPSTSLLLSFGLYRLREGTSSKAELLERS